MRFLCNKKVHMTAFAVYYLVLTVEYWNFVCRNFAHMKFYWEPATLSIVIGTVFLVGLFLCLFKMESSSDETYALSTFAATMLSIPAIVYYQFGGGSIFTCIYSLLFIFLVNCKKFRIPTFKSPVVPQKYQIPILGFIALVMFVPFVMTYGLNLHFGAFSMGREIYSIRAAANAQASPFLAYVFGPLLKVALPLLLIYGIFKKKWWLWMLIIITMLYVFLVYPHKTIFFSIFFVLIFCFFDDYKAKAGLIFTGMTLMVIASALYTIGTGKIMAESICIRRVLFIPTQLSTVYFSYFQNNQVFLSHSIFRYFLSYPYPYEPAHMIGQYLYGTPGTSSNTGFIGDGYLNFGHLGSLAFTIGLAGVLRFWESLKTHPVFFGSILFALFTFFNSAFLTCFMTHGLFFLLVLALFFLKDSDTTQNKS